MAARAQVGIPAAQLSQVWGRFKQGEMGPARQHCGAGLGLCLVRGLVQAQGGRVQLSSQEGRGTTVALALTAWDDASGPRLVAAHQLQQQQQQQQAQEAQQQQGQQAQEAQEVQQAQGGQQQGGLALDMPPPADLAPRPGGRLRTSSSTQSLAVMLASATGGPAAEQGQQGQQGQQLSRQRSVERHPSPPSGSLPGLSKPCHRERHGSVQVLCVDDDPISQLVVKRLLGPSGGWRRPRGCAPAQPARLHLRRPLTRLLLSAAPPLHARCPAAPRPPPRLAHPSTPHTHTSAAACPARRLPHCAGQERGGGAALPGGRRGVPRRGAAGRDDARAQRHRHLPHHPPALARLRHPHHHAVCQQQRGAHQQRAQRGCGARRLPRVHALLCFDPLAPPPPRPAGAWPAHASPCTPAPLRPALP
jgi:hypothetical protein